MTDKLSELRFILCVIAWVIFLVACVPGVIVLLTLAFQP